MSVYPATLPGADRDELVFFLHETGKILQAIVDSRWVFFRQEIRPLVFAAWNDVKGKLSNVRGMIAGGGHDTALIDEGLFGSQLRLKMQSFRHALHRLVQWGGWKPLHDILKKINIILKSILKALGLDDALTEFKEIIEDFIENMGQDDGGPIPGEPPAGLNFTTS